MTKYLAPLADAKQFPVPQVKSNASVLQPGAHQRRLPEQASSAMLVDKGRTALFVIAQFLDEKSVVWLPSYHCPALIEPFVHAGRTIRFYPLTSDLVPDFEHLAAQVQAGDSLVTVRYFGFECEVEYASQFCAKHQLLHIEDLAHAALATKLYGALGITSLTKFYPSTQAGELLLSKAFSQEARLTSLYRQLPSRWWYLSKQFIQKIQGKLGVRKRSNGYFNLDHLHRIQPQQINSAINAMSGEDIIAKRRQHYADIHRWLVDCDWAEPLFELANNVAPYVIPALIRDERYFTHMRTSGIQILRWEELSTEVTCPVANDYRRRLIQIPCHQDLTDQALGLIKQALQAQK